MKLVEKGEVLQDDKKIAEKLNTFFKNAVFTLDANENSSTINPKSQKFLNSIGTLCNIFQTQSIT